MSAIEVKRVGDGSTRAFDINEIGDGTLLNWVTQNDSTADGLVRFLNQVGETGNATTPDSLERFPKIVKGGSLVTDGNGSPIVDWDGENDGFEYNVAEDLSIPSSTTQVAEMTVDVSAFNGTPQTIINCGGLRVWEWEGRIYATIKNPDTSWEQFQNGPGDIRGFTSYNGDLYLFSFNDNTIYRFDKQNSSFVDIGPSSGINTGSYMAMFVFNEKLWSMDSGDPVTFWTYDGTSWSSDQVSSPVGQKIGGSAFIPYKENLYVVYSGGPNNSGGIMKYNTDNQDWETDFLLSSDISNIIGEDVGIESANVAIWGAGVWRDEIYFPLFSRGGGFNQGDRILKYNPEDDWKIYHEYSDNITFTTVANPYDDAIYNPQAFTKFSAQRFKNSKNSEFDIVWDETDTGSLSYQAAMKTYDEDLYIGHRYSDAYDGSVDGVYKWDGESIQVDLQTDGGPWQALGIHNGELWASHTSAAGEVYKKGNGAEISVPYNTSANEFQISAAAFESGLYLEVDGQVNFKKHSIDYKNTGKIRLGLSYGAKHTDQHAGVDEVFRGGVKEFVYYQDTTQEIDENIFDSGSASISVFYSTDSSVQGNASFSFPDAVSKYEVLSSSNQSGAFSEIKAINDPEKQEISWEETGLNQGETRYYKFKVTSNSGNITESQTVSRATEYPQPSDPEVQIEDVSSSEVSGTISSPDPDIFFDKFELYKSLNSGTPYNKIQEFNNPSGDTVTWTDDTVDSGETYFYVTKALKTDAPIESDYSDEKSADTTESQKTEETWESYNTGKTISEISTPFSFTNGTDWFVDDEYSRVGSQSLRSDDISDDQTTAAEIEFSSNKRKQLIIQWGSDSESGYDEVYLRRNGNEIKNLSGPNESSKDLLSIPSGTINIEVSYEKDGSVSDHSDSAWIHQLIEAPVIPPEFTADVEKSSGEVTVDHLHSVGNDVDGDFNGFHVYVDGSKVTSSPQSVGGTYTTGSLDQGNHTIGVTNVRADGIESSEVQKTVSIPTIVNLAVSESSSGLALSWDTTDPNSSYYNVYRADSSGGNYTQINSSNVTSTSYTDDTTQSGEIYFYKVSSVNNNGNESDLSDFASNAFTVSDGETKTLSDTEVSYVGFEVNGTLNIEGKVTLNIGSFFEVGSSGTIDGSENGFEPGSGDHADGNGPGGGFGQNDDGGIGGSYGGQGGSAQDALSSPPSTYGDSKSAEAQKGSAGGNGDGNSLGGSGGAALEVLASNDSFSATVDGTMNFDGQQGQHDGSSSRAGGGGSGGGVYIESDITGNGTITAKGGDGTAYENDGGGAGGGGRLKALSFGSNITTDVSGGTIPSGGDGKPGDDGTVAELIFAVPENLDGSYDSNATEIELTWEATDPDINHYNAYRSTTSGSGFSKINTSNISSKSYIDDSVSEGETYYYKASSVDSSGNESDLSDEISVAAKDVITVFSEGFESDLSNWNANNNFERKTDAVYAGSYSGGKDAGDYAGPDEAVASISPTQINEISWYWREESSQYGSSISLYNSNGDRELAAGTENPEWTFWDDTGQDDIIYSTGVYETWMYIRLHNFDWANGTYDYYYENTSSGHVETGTRSMNHGVDVSEIWLGTRPNDTSGPLYCRWDEIEVLS